MMPAFQKTSAMTLLKMFLSTFFPPFKFVVGFHFQILVAGSTGGFCEKLLGCTSNMKLPLSQAEPINDSGRAFGTTYLRREDKWRLQPDGGVGIHGRNISAAPRVSAEGAPGPEAWIDSLAACDTVHGEAAVPSEVHGGQKSTHSPWRSMGKQRSTYTLWKTPHGSK